MTRRLVLPLAFIALVLLFFVFNRGAYRGYFDGDDLDNIAWSTPLDVYDVVIPMFNPIVGGGGNYRAAGQLMYVVLGKSVGLSFAPYIAWIHFVHLLTTGLLFVLLRRLGFQQWSALAGTVFFAFDMAVFDIFWKPMYVFDLTCGLFCILTLIAWTYERWFLALACFWLAFKAKELAVMLPFVLAGYEYFIGQRRWKRLELFFGISLLLGAQAAWANTNRNNDYTFRFTPTALWNTLRFYFSKLLWLPALVTPLVVRNPRVWFGLTTFALFLAPLLFLPGRTFGAYLYVPSIGLAVLMASLLQRPEVIAIFFAVWLPLNFISMRHQRVPLIAGQHENQKYAQALAASIRANGISDAYVYQRTPEQMHSWGLIGLLKILAPGAPVYEDETDDAQKALHGRSVSLLRWHPEWDDIRITARTANTPNAPYIKIDAVTPVWQLGDGWYGHEGAFRWIQPRATAELERPPGAKEFELRVLISQRLIDADKQIRTEVLLNGKPLGSHVFTEHGLFTVAWPLPADEPGPAQVEFRVTPTFTGNADGSHPLGIAITGFGFK